MNNRATINNIFSQLKGARFNIRLWDNQILKFGDGDEIAFELFFTDKKSLKRLLAQGALGFGETYMDGSLKITGDIESYLSLRHQFKTIKPSLGLRLAAIYARASINKERSEQISHHYDLGNDFFELFLDKQTISYSSGLFVTGTESLKESQLQKNELINRWLKLPKHSKILDLGSGWGGFAIQAAQNNSWNVTGTTLSRNQLNYCEELIKKSNVNDRICFEYGDMLKSLPDKKFDGIVMLESIEHIGKKNIDNFVAKLYDQLKPGGRVYIQMTGRHIPKEVDTWTLKYVFPGGYLLSKGQLELAAEKAGFNILKFEEDTGSYIATMTKWINNIEKNEQLIRKRYGDSFYLLWHLWTHGAKVSFEQNSMSLFRVLLAKPSI